jgi:hypothetical protein
MTPNSTREVPEREPYVQRDRQGKVVKPGSQRANREPADRAARPSDRRRSGGRGRDAGSGRGKNR